jgi:hypothetical protein
MKILISERGIHETGCHLCIPGDLACRTMKSQTFDQIGRSLINPTSVVGEYGQGSVTAPTNIVRSMLRLWDFMTDRLITDVHPERRSISLMVLQQAIMEWDPEQHF